MQATSTPVSRQNLADDLAQRIAQLIRSGEHASGDRLPASATMARPFGVGAPTRLVITHPIRHDARDRVVSKKPLVDLIAARIPIGVTSATLAGRRMRTHLDGVREVLLRREPVDTPLA